MRRSVIGIALLFVATGAVAQQPNANPAGAAAKTFSSAAEVAALITRAKGERKGDQPIVTESILKLAPYNANLEYRASVGPAALHKKEAEMFYVIDGRATMMTGGKLVNETQTDADNLNGTGIEGGSSRTVAKGDFIIVPENTPHWFSSIEGTIVLMSLHVPRPVSAAR